MPRRKKHYRKMRLILGDQLNPSHSWFDDRDPDVLYLLAELRQETDYVKHHVQKICAFFAAMAEFAERLEADGHAVLFLTLDETADYPDLTQLIQSLCETYSVESFAYQAPDEYRLQQQLAAIELPGKVTVHECDSEHFLLGRDELEDCIERGKHNRMESFYRDMRRRFGYLMENGKPEGGKWNFDAENRKKLQAADLEELPKPMVFNNDVEPVLRRLERHGVEFFGEADESLLWPVNLTQARQLLQYFCRRCLPRFGRFQDAMTCRSPHRWSLYHSRLSFALNAKILHPREVIEAAIEQYRENDEISIAQVEGFVRQILGWREYVRAVYWVNMPDYARRNRLRARRDLPGFFWSGQTKMNCMREALSQSLQYAYAHHIQRLMITGNFCLLAGIDPNQVDAWYLGVYVDAVEWVEMPNTRGMSQFADGGLIATKPYSAGANYIGKMSDYCGDCHYVSSEKTGEKACPFNSLYWDFMLRHRDRFERNPRIGMIYRNWDRQDKAKRKTTLERADWCLRHLDEL